MLLVNDPCYRKHFNKRTVLSQKYICALHAILNKFIFYTLKYLFHSTCINWFLQIMIRRKFSFQWIYWCNKTVDFPGENTIGSGVSCPCRQDHAFPRGLGLLLQGLLLTTCTNTYPSIINFMTFGRKIIFCS